MKNKTLAPSAVTSRDSKGLKFMSIVGEAYDKAKLSEKEAQSVNDSPGLAKHIAKFINKNRNRIESLPTGKEIAHCGSPLKRNPIFLLPEQQFSEFISYNEWLKNEAPKHRIPRKEIEDLEILVPKLAMNDLIFYGHKNDQRDKYDALTTYRLAWEYIRIQQSKKYSYEVDVFPGEKLYIGLMSGEPKRPMGFYTKKLHEDDYKAGGIGKRFHGRSMSDAIRHIRQEKSWGMGTEGLQFMFTHPHYLNLMKKKNRGNVRPLCLPGLKVTTPRYAGYVEHPGIVHNSQGIELTYHDTDGEYPAWGAGSLV